jgi:hypothetical protein
MNNRKPFFLGLLALFPVLIWAELYMVVEYNTNGTVKRNIFNITMQTVNLNIKILGCDEGYYEGWNGTNLACTECICEEFDDTRSDQFFCT